MFQFKALRIDNYRCFEAVDLRLEPDLTVIFAENGGGKTSILDALGLGLGVFLPGRPSRHTRQLHKVIRCITLDERGRREPAGNCKILWSAAIGEFNNVEWSISINGASTRSSHSSQAAQEAIETTRKPGERWPLIAWYGTNRMAHGKPSSRPAASRPDRWEGYSGSLNPDQDDSALLTWLLEEILADAVRRQEGEEERFLASAVMDALAIATPGVTRAWYDPRERSPMVRFENGEAAPWTELSDGYHVFLALVADLARRAVILNETDGGEAAANVEGVVLIDEIDLHLHPRWQRVVLKGLRKVFPRIQFVVTTHSPQVLSSVLNRQVRLLCEGTLFDGPVHVEGRDSNAIMREYFGTDDRDSRGTELLSQLDDAIDSNNKAKAHEIFSSLRDLWGNLDPALIRRHSRVQRMM